MSGSTAAPAPGLPARRVFIVHGSGAITALRHLASLPTPWTFGGLVLVAGSTGRLDALPVLDDFLAGDVDLTTAPRTSITATTVRAKNVPRHDHIQALCRRTHPIEAGFGE